jgi:hypothetical protein
MLIKSREHRKRRGAGACRNERSATAVNGKFARKIPHFCRLQRRVTTACNVTIYRERSRTCSVSGSARPRRVKLCRREANFPEEAARAGRMRRRRRARVRRAVARREVRGVAQRGHVMSCIMCCIAVDARRSRSAMSAFGAIAFGAITVGDDERFSRAALPTRLAPRRRGAGSLGGAVRIGLRSDGAASETEELPRAASTARAGFSDACRLWFPSHLACSRSDGSRNAP